MNKRETTDRIYIHHTVTDRNKTTREQIKQMHLHRGFSDVGYHYLIHGDGRIEAGRDEAMTGAHTLNHNYNSIGVSCTGTFTAGRDVMAVGDAQYLGLVEIVSRMCRKYGIPVDKVFGHRDGQATECPGTIYPLIPGIREAVRARMAQ